MRTTSTSGQFDADYSVFTAIAFRSIDSQFMESFEIVFVDRRDAGASLSSLDEGAKGVNQIGLIIRHK